MKDKMDELFWDSDGGGYFTSAAGDESIVLRLKEDQVPRCCGDVQLLVVCIMFETISRTAPNLLATRWPPRTS